MAAKKKSSKKATAKRSTAKRAGGKKSTAKRATAKRSTAKKAGAARSTKKKAAARPAAVRAVQPAAPKPSTTFTGGRPVARPAEPPPSLPSYGGFGSEPGMGSESESGSAGGSERIKIGERPPEQTWPGGGSR